MHLKNEPRNAYWTYALRGARLVLWLYVFAVSIKLMGDSFKELASQFDIEGLLSRSTSNPIEGVCIGLLATAIAQSSSFTTSMLVGLVATGLIPLQQAIPIVMGANIGTTITSQLVATAHVARRNEFKLAFCAGTVHDVFNILTVLVLLPLEYTFHILQHTAELFMTPLAKAYGKGGGEMSKGPLDAILHPMVGLIEHTLKYISENQTFLGVGLLIMAIVLLFFALAEMVVLLRQIFSRGAENFLDEVLFKRWWSALLFGIILTAVVQSSSMTVSLMVPLVASGVITVERAFPMTLGANIGTTITAFMAAIITGNPTAVGLALTHLFFNLFGTAIFLPLSFIPISIAKALAEQVYKRRYLAFVYVLIMFIVIPIFIITLLEIF